MRDYIYIGDVADAFVRAIGYTGTENVFNISSGMGTSLNDLVSMIEKAVRRPVERRYMPGRAFDVPVSVLSNERACREFGWAPTVALQDGISLTAQWMERQLAK